jgi:hypothetical protein
MCNQLFRNKTNSQLFKQNLSKDNRMHVKLALRIVPLILSFIGGTLCGCASPNTPVKTFANDDNSSLQAHTPNSKKEADVQAEVPPLPKTTNLNSLHFQPRRDQKTSPCSTLATPEPLYTEPLTPAEMKQNLAVAKKIIEEFQALKTTMPEFEVELPPEVQDWFCQRVDCSQPPNYIGCGGWDSFNQFNECCPDEAQKCADVQVSYGCQVGENFGYSGLGINQPPPIQKSKNAGWRKNANNSRLKRRNGKRNEKQNRKNGKRKAGGLAVISTILFNGKTQSTNTIASLKVLPQPLILKYSNCSLTTGQKRKTTPSTARKRTCTSRRTSYYIPLLRSE